MVDKPFIRSKTLELNQANQACRILTSKVKEERRNNNGNLADHSQGEWAGIFANACGLMSNLKALIKELEVPAEEE